jgi:hypothetical protein
MRLPVRDRIIIALIVLAFAGIFWLGLYALSTFPAVNVRDPTLY